MIVCIIQHGKIYMHHRCCCCLPLDRDDDDEEKMLIHVLYSRGYNLLPSIAYESNKQTKNQTQNLSAERKESNRIFGFFFFFLTQKMHTALEKKKHRRLSVHINDDGKKKKKSLQPRGKKSDEEIVQRP